MTYTLWQNNVQIGYTFGTVRLDRPFAIFAKLVLTEPLSILGGLTQFIDPFDPRGRVEHFTSPIESSGPPPSPSVNCPKHAGSGQVCYPVQQYFGPFNYVDKACELVLRDPAGDALNAIWISINDWSAIFAEALPSAPVDQFPAMPLVLSAYWGDLANPPVSN